MALVNCRSSFTRWTTLAMALVLLSAPMVRAQAVYGSIAGTIADSTGATVPGATVTITSIERKNAQSVVTNASGYYAKDRLLPGRYEVKAELAGFKTAQVSRVVINVDTQTMVNLRLEVGEMSESVTVEGAASLLKSDRADVATVFESKQLTELPVLDRNFTKFLLLTPGTQQQTWQHAASENPQGSTQTMVNGQTFSGTGWQLDGTDNRDVILGIVVVNSTLESIGESKITSQNYDAEFGQAVAGVVSVQTKSGTNSFHGSVFEFAQRDKFQARNPFSQPDTPNPVTGKVLPETKKDQFGASIGGPIVKNKFFFFGDYQGSRNTVGGSRLLTVPTAAARAGDLSAYGTNIYDPLTGAPSQRQQFAGNIIPSNRLSPQSQAILKSLPLPNAPGRDNGTRDNYIAQGSEAFDADQFNTRFDGRINDRLNVFGRYSFAKYALTGPTAFGEGGGPELVSLGGNSKVKNHSVAAGFDYTLNSTTILDFRFGWYQYKVDVLPFDFGTTPAADAGIPGLNFDDFSSGLPYLDIQGDRGFRMGSGLDANRCNCPLAQDEKQWQVVSNLTKVFGNHTAKFGLDIRRAYNLRVPSDAHRSGQLHFSDNRTIGPNGGGLGIATFLLGDVSSFERFVSTSTDAREQQWRHFYYVQDTWRASRKLTINAGLRADIYNPQTVNEAGNGGWLDINTGEMRVGGVGDINLAGNVENQINWAPRLGLSYQVNAKTVVRAGYGRSYDTGVFGSIFGHAVTQNLPVLSIQNLNAPNNYDSVFNLAQGPSAPVFVSPGPDGRFALPNGVSARLLLDKQNVPALDAWNITIQRELTNTISAELAYVGNHSNRAFIGNGPAANYNDPTLVGYPDLNTNQRRPFYSGPIAGAPLGAQGDSGQLRRGLRLDPGRRLLLQLRQDRLPVGPGQDHAAVLQRLVAARPLHPAEGAEQRRQLLLHRPEPELRDQRVQPHAQLRGVRPGRAAVRQGEEVRVGCHRGQGRPDRRLAGQHQRLRPERLALQRRLRRIWQRPGHGVGPSGPHRGSFRAREPGPVVQHRTHRLGRQRVRPARPGDFRQHGAQQSDRPRLLERRCLALQAFPHGRQHQPGVPGRGREPLQPREPRAARQHGGDAHRPATQRGADHRHRGPEPDA